MTTTKKTHSNTKSKQLQLAHRARQYDRRRRCYFEALAASTKARKAAERLEAKTDAFFASWVELEDPKAAAILRGAP